MAAVNIDIKSLQGAAVVGALVSVFDLSNVLEDSGLTDGSGRFATTLSVAQHKVMVAKDGVAAGNSTVITVT